MHGKVEVYVDCDDKVGSEQLVSIGGSGIGDSDFDSWKVIFNCRTQKEFTEALEKILELLTK